MLKKITLILVLILALTSLTYAQDMMDLSGVDPSGQTITYWHQYSTDSAQGDTITALVQQFNETNEYGITVEEIFQGSYGPIEDLMETAILSGELPNLVAGYANAAASWSNEGVVINVNDLINDATWGLGDDLMGGLNFTILDVNGDADSMRVAWANQYSASVLFVNLDMIERLGFERRPPANMQEFRDIACAAAESGINGYPIKGGSSEFESYVATFGGNIYNTQTGEYDLTTPEVIATLEFFQALHADGCAYFGAERFFETADFARGENAFAISSTAGIPFVQSDFETNEIDDEWVIAPVPGATDDLADTVQVFVPSQVILASTPEQIVATWEFVKFLAQQEQQLEWASNTGYFHTRNDLEGVLTEDVFSNPRTPFSYYQASLDIITDPDISVYASPPLASYSGVRGLLGDVFSEITVGGADINELMADLTEEANELREDMDG